MRKICSIFVLAIFTFGVICSSLLSVLSTSNAVGGHAHHTMGASVHSQSTDHQQSEHEKRCIEHCQKSYLGSAKTPEKKLQLSTTACQFLALQAVFALAIVSECKDGVDLPHATEPLALTSSDLYARTLRYRL